jgi:hypothetical protein
MRDAPTPVESELLKKLLEVLSTSDSLHVQIGYLENKDADIQKTIDKMRYDLYGNGTPGVIGKLDNIGNNVDKIAATLKKQDKQKEDEIATRKKNMKKLKLWILSGIGGLILTGIGTYVNKHINHTYDKRVIEKKKSPEPLGPSEIIIKD